MSSYSLKNLVVGNEAFGGRFEDEEDTSVSIEVENEIIEEMEEQEEIVEVVKDNEEITEAVNEMMATFEYAERMTLIVEQYGWSKPVAMVFNHGQFNGRLGEVEESFGITLPANESLELTVSPYDSNSIAVMEGFKDTMKKFWEWIKKGAKRIWEGIKNLGSKILAFFVSVERTSKRLATALKDVNSIDPEKAKDKKFKIMKRKIFVGLIGVIDKILVYGFKFAKREYIEEDKNFDVLGFSVSKDGSVKFNDKNSTIKDIVDASKEESFHGNTIALWTLDDVKDNKLIVTLIANGRKIEQTINEMKKLSSKLESDANKYSKMYSNEDDAKSAKDARDEAKKDMKYITGAQKIITKCIKDSVYLAKHFIKVQRAFLACKA